MPYSISKRSRVAPGLVLAIALALSGGASWLYAAENDQSKLPISLDAASSDVDYRSNTVIFRDVVISQGDIRVQAKRAEATGLNFENSRWSFTGDVRIRVQNQGNLQSDEAIVDFRNNRISRATITGKPAEFEQKRSDTGELARGRAGEIVYEVAEGKISLADDAWLTDGRTEISGPSVVYDVRQERVQAITEPGASERVRIVIQPQKPTEQSNRK